MCFSAEASFAAATTTSVLGVYCLSRSRGSREWLIAAMPLVFGAQQAVEGLLWLSLPAGAAGCASSGLTLGFLSIAHGVWPVYASLAALLAEPSGRRRRLMAANLALGAGLAGYLMWGLITHAPQASLARRHIIYSTGQPEPVGVAMVYLGVICLPLLLSSRSGVAAMGVIVLFGAIAAFIFYDAGFQSIWCYFAALASLMLAFDFRRRRNPDELGRLGGRAQIRFVRPWRYTGSSPICRQRKALLEGDDDAKGGPASASDVDLSTSTADKFR